MFNCSREVVEEVKHSKVGWIHGVMWHPERYHLFRERGVKLIQGEKMISYSDSNGKQLWDYTLYGTFTVNPGVSAPCTSVTGSPKIYDNSWSVASNTPSRSGNKATGKITMQKKFSGSVVQTVSKTVTLTCDANDKLS